MMYVITLQFANRKYNSNMAALCFRKPEVGLVITQPWIEIGLGYVKVCRYDSLYSTVTKSTVNMEFLANVNSSSRSL